MSIKARRKNLRMYNLDEGDLQGNYSLMVRAAQQEALAPSSPTIGVTHDAICLFAFKIRDNAPNVPPIQPIKRHIPAGGDEAEKTARSGKWRIAVHALIGEYDSDAIGPSGMEHAAHCLPNPFDQKSISKADYVRLAKRFPIYVGGYLDENGRDLVSANEQSMGFISPGTALRVRDNDVQGGMYGTVLDQLDTGKVQTQFVQGDLKSLFDGSEGGAGYPDGPTVYDEGFDENAEVYEGAGYTWAEVTRTSKATNQTPDATQQLNLQRLVREILVPLRDASNPPSANPIPTFSINSAFRSQETNTAVGGADNSDHMSGLAVDLAFTGAQKGSAAERTLQLELFNTKIPALISFGQMIIYEHKGHIHISAGTRGQKLVTTMNEEVIAYDEYTGTLTSFLV